LGRRAVELAKQPRIHFDLEGEIDNIDVIGVGGSIREIMRLRKQFGPGRWRKLKGTATVVLENGTSLRAVVCWHEAHGVGKRKMKIKRFLD